MTMRPGHRHGRAALAGAAFLTLAVSVALAAAPPPRHTKPKPQPAPPAPAAKATPPAAPAATAPAGTLGLMAFLDPETGLLTGPIGQLVPPADQQAAAANVLLESVRTPSGGWLLDLKGTGMEFYVLQVDAFGRRYVSCVQDVRHVPVLLPRPATPLAVER